MFKLSASVQSLLKFSQFDPDTASEGIFRGPRVADATKAREVFAIMGNSVP